MFSFFKKEYSHKKKIQHLKYNKMRCEKREEQTSFF